jgi:sec-independent protein translocase protein TatC
MSEKPTDERKTVTPSAADGMPLWQHLEELRNAMIRSLVALGIGVLITYNFSESLVGYLERPLLRVLPEGEKALFYTGITDKFFIYLPVAVIAAAALVSPFLLYEVWKFIAPGLHSHERRFVLPFIVLGTVSFAVGAAFAFYVVIPYGYEFLIHFGSPQEKPIITLTEYFSLTLKLMALLGLTFELPALFLLLAKIGLVDGPMLARFRRHALVGSSVAAALLTPTPDAFTMLLVMIPLYALYEVSIVAVKWAVPNGRSLRRE